MGILDGVGGGLVAAGTVPSPASPFLLAAGIGASLFGSLFGAHQQASAAGDAARIQAEAARYAADLQAKANAESLAFTRAQAENAYQNSEAARQGNYGQWAAAQRRIGTLGQMLNLGPREIPGYVPGVDPNFGGAATAIPVGSGQTPAAAAASGSAAPPATVQAAMALANKTAYGFDKHTDQNYWAAMYAKDPDYAFKRMLGWQAGAADAAKMGPYAGGAGAPSAAASGPPAGSIAALIGANPMPYLTPTIAPALRNPYAPGTVGAYLS